jgi:2'-5' RNA ligase
VTVRAGGETPDFWRLVDQASGFELAGSIRALGYAAHLSLGLYETIAPEDLSSAAAALKQMPALTLRFASISWFDADPLVLWLAPEQNDRLTALHACLHDHVGAEQSAAYYRPGAWIPHCTIAAQVAPALRNPALAFARKSIEPFNIRFDLIDTVQFPPVRILSSMQLSGE